MVQVLPYVQSFGEKLAPVLANALGSVGQGYQQGVINKKDAALIEKLKTSSPLEAAGIIPQLSEKKRQAYEASYKPFIAEAAKSQTKETERLEAEKRTYEDVKSTLDTLQGLKEYAGSTKIPFTSSFNATELGLNRKGLKKRAQIDTQALKLEKLLINENSKGTLRGKTFDILMEKIPHSDDSEAVYQGKLDAFYEEINKLSPKMQKEIGKAISQDEKSGERPPLESFVR